MIRLRWLAALLVLIAGATCAQERILDFASDVSVEQDGSLLVVETIKVQVEGKQIRRGIFRDFPTDYQDRRGVQTIVPFNVLDVQRDGASEPFSLERLDNGTRVRIGSAGVMLPHGPHEYRITYRTARQLGFFEQHDELYWNVTGNGWPFVIERVNARVRLPRAISSEKLRAEAFTGPFGAKGGDAIATIDGSEFLFETTRRLAPKEGLTIVAVFPKGIVAEPSSFRRLMWRVTDNAAELVAISGVLLVILFLFWIWWRIGRDPRAGPKVPRYDPPEGVSAAGVRFIDNMGFDFRCFAAAVLGLGARGYLKVRQHGDNFSIEKTGHEVGWLPGDKPMASALFGGGSHATLSKTYDPAVAAAQSELKSALRHHYKDTAFKLNGWPLWIAVLAGIAILAFAGSVGANPILLIALAVLLVLSLFIFSRLMPAYTREGRRLQDHIEGLRQYLGVAEADDLARMKAPEMTPAEFARMLPYALALDVSKTWADRFASVLGAGAVAAAVSSYYGGDTSSWGDDPASGLSNSLGALDSTVSSASTPPGSDSGSSGGSGGGGSSGGGGGGGGGGGW